MSEWHREQFGSKVCTRCELEKGIDEFGRRDRTRNGRKAWCKPCEREIQREWAARNRDKERERWRRNHNGAAQLERNKAWRAANPEKKAAHQAVRYAVAVGMLTRPDACEKCGKACRPHGHHPDYQHQLDVRWLCAACHRAAHTYAKAA